MKLWQQQKLARMCSNRNSHSLLVRIMKNVIAILEDWFFFLLYFFLNKTVPIYDPESVFRDIYLSKVENLHTQKNSHANVYCSFIHDDQNFEVTKMFFSRWTDKLIGVQPDNRILFSDEKKWVVKTCSVQFSCSVMSNSLQPRGLQHFRLPCPSPTPRACSNSCPSSWWCHLIISSSVIPFSSFIQSFSASGSFPTSQFSSGGQSIGVLASASVLPSNEYSGLISLRIDWLDILVVQGTLKSLLQHRGSKASIPQHLAFFIVQLSHPYMITGKDPDAGKDWRQKEKGMTEDEMIR